MDVNQNKRIIAFGLLTQHDLDLLGPTFDRAWPVEDDHSFEELLRKLDEVDVRREAAPSPTSDFPAT